MLDRTETPNWGRTRQAKADRALECHQILTLGLERAYDEAAKRFLRRTTEAGEREHYERALEQEREALENELERIHGDGGEDEPGSGEDEPGSGEDEPDRAEEDPGDGPDRGQPN